MKRHAAPAFFLTNSEFTSDKDVDMNHRIKQVSLYVGVAVLLVASTGCGALNWRKGKATETMTAQEYAQQAVENIDYDNSIDFARDYTPNSTSTAGYLSTPKRDRTPAGSSASGGSCCSH